MEDNGEYANWTPFNLKIQPPKDNYLEPDATVIPEPITSKSRTRKLSRQFER
jgi:hypothetical protein